MELDQIEKPVLKIADIKTEDFNLPVFKLDGYSEWCLTALKSVDQSRGARPGKVSVEEWKLKLKSFFDERIEAEVDKLELEVRADAELMSRDDMFTVATNLQKEVIDLGLMRLGSILHHMARAITFETKAKPDFDKYRGMFPILQTELRNTTYVVRMFLGEQFDKAEFEKLQFREGQRPDGAEPNAGVQDKPPVSQPLPNPSPAVSAEPAAAPQSQSVEQPAERTSARLVEKPAEKPVAAEEAKEGAKGAMTAEELQKKREKDARGRERAKMNA